MAAVVHPKGHIAGLSSRDFSGKSVCIAFSLNSLLHLQ